MTARTKPYSDLLAAAREGRPPDVDLWIPPAQRFAHVRDILRAGGNALSVLEDPDMELTLVPIIDEALDRLEQSSAPALTLAVAEGLEHWQMLMTEAVRQSRSVRALLDNWGPAQVPDAERRQRIANGFIAQILGSALRPDERDTDFDPAREIAGLAVFLHVSAAEILELMARLGELNQELEEQM